MAFCRARAKSLGRYIRTGNAQRVPLTSRGIKSSAMMVACVTIVTISSMALANADTCSSYVGQEVVPKSFEDVATIFAGVSPKGEFETTEAFKARISSIVGALPNVPFLIEKKPDDRQFFEYDADKEVLSIVAFAFGNKAFVPRRAFSEVAERDSLNIDPLHSNLAIVVNRTGETLGTYEAVNGFGAKVVITKLQLYSDVIYEGKHGAYSHQYFRKQSEGKSYIGSLNLNPSDARRLKDEIRLALVVSPKEPYLVTGTYHLDEATFDSPVESVDTYRSLIADIQCGLVMDGSGKVLGAYQTY